MTNPPRWIPEAHDSILKELHSLALTDPMIRDRMADMGHHFSVPTISVHRGRLKLKGNSRNGWEIHAPVRDKPNPLHLAQMVLGKRLVEKPSGYWMDGRPVSLTTIMQAANAVRQKMGLQPIPGPSHWAAPPERPTP